MNNLQSFNNSLFGEVRFVEVEGKPYAVAKDIAKALGYSNPQKAIRDHCKGVNETLLPTNGGNQIIKIIPEGDIYRLIVRSKLPQAERFEQWVFDEVLPSIRKNGAYMTPPTIEQMIQNPDFAIQLLTSLKEEQQQRKIAEQKAKESQEFIDNVIGCSEECVTIEEFAKLTKEEFGMGRNKLYEWMRKRGFLRKDEKGDHIPYQRYMDAGTFEIREKKGYDRKMHIQSMITPKGQQYLYRCLKTEFYNQEKFNL